MFVKKCTDKIAKSINVQISIEYLLNAVQT